MDKKHKNGNLAGKGYYIALGLCSVAIAIAGFLYYKNADPGNSTLQKNTVATQGSGSSDVQAVAPQTGEETPVVTPKKPDTIKMPLSGQTVVPYAMETLGYNQTTRDWRVHDGMDIAAPAGTEVCAAASGTVYTVYNDETMGMTVVLQHEGGYTTRYASLSETVSVKAGDTVTAGQKLGTVGNTALLENAIGEHLHFSVSCNGTLQDPAEFLGK